MKRVIPPKLHRGDHLRVVAPALSRAFVAENDESPIIESRFAGMGVRLSFGTHVDERDDFDSSSIRSRVSDLHDAFADPGVAGILTVIGGLNSNELLPYLDWDLISANPKVLCGYSDITALQNAILARTGLVSYSGPHWSTFGMRDHLDETFEWFTAALFDEAPVTVRPSANWTDDLWFLDQDARTLRPNEGWWPLRPGAAEAPIVGGHLATLTLLGGTPWMPPLDGALLFLEDDADSDVGAFARELTSLLHLPGAEGVRGLVVGRFQPASGMTRSLLDQIVDRQPALRGKPVLANVDFGHTNPLMTFPIGGTVAVRVGGSDSLVLTEH